MFECKKCKGKKESVVFVPFKNPNYRVVSDAKYLFHLKSVCVDCETFNGFKKQTDELMISLKDSVLISRNSVNSISID